MIGADGAFIDGARHSAFEGQGDAAGTGDVQQGSGEVSATEDVPSVPDGGSSQGDSAVTDQSACTPECAGKACGDDGCGGVCGDCPAAFPFCLGGVCSNCEPQCEGVACGSNGCGGSCGSCGAGETCESGACVCQPSCPEPACGEDDGCGGLCPPCLQPDVADTTSDALASDVSGDGLGSDADGSPGPDAEDASSDTSVADADGSSEILNDGGTTPDGSGDIPSDGSSEDGGTGEDTPDGAQSDAEGPGDAPVDDTPDTVASDVPPPEEDLGPPIPAPTLGELVITEVMRAPLDGAAPGRQWFEIVSVVDGERDLSGCTFADALGAGLVVPDDQLLLAFEPMVFAQEGDDQDGLLGADMLYPTVADGGPDLSEVGLLSFSCAGDLIDSVDLSVVAGTTAFPDELGRAMQLDSGATHATTNDSPGAWCSSFKLYGAAGYGSPGVGNHPCDSEVDWCRIWSPGFKLASVNELWEVTTHLHEGGLTDLTANAPDSSPTLKAQVGYGADGSLPAEVPDQWTWFTAVAVEDPPAAVPASDDRYIGVVTMTSTGIYDVAGRFSLDDGFTWTYCDLDGSANGYSKTSTGHATIIP